LDKNLITVVGRKEGVGRPLLYGTTRHFLASFGLRDLSELPKIEDMKEVLEQQSG
jgi:segregation and condensation protein B